LHGGSLNERTNRRRHIAVKTHKLCGAAHVQSVVRPFTAIGTTSAATPVIPRTARMAFPRVGVTGLPVDQKANRLFPRGNVPVDAGRFFAFFSVAFFAVSFLAFSFRRFVVLFLVVVARRSLVRRSRSERFLAL
jgi:hypothetical protein